MNNFHLKNSKMRELALRNNTACDYKLLCQQAVQICMLSMVASKDLRLTSADSMCAQQSDSHPTNAQRNHKHGTGNSGGGSEELFYMNPFLANKDSQNDVSVNEDNSDGSDRGEL